MPTPTTLKYTVEIQAVRELNLVGRADLAFWTAHLAGTGLRPQSVDGHAEVTLGVTDLTWMGIRFNESILTLTLAEAGGAPLATAGAYLVHAFNSKRSLAFMERTFFKTPYYRAAIDLPAGTPNRFTVTDPAGGVVRADTGSSAGRPRRATDETWVGAVHLPLRPTAPQGRGGYFYVKLAGPGEAYPFVTGSDTFSLTPSAASPVFAWLRDSQFTPLEWRYRPAATHGKSPTYPRE